MSFEEEFPSLWEYGRQDKFIERNMQDGSNESFFVWKQEDIQLHCVDRALLLQKLEEQYLEAVKCYKDLQPQKLIDIERILTKLTYSLGFKDNPLLKVYQEFPDGEKK